LNRGLSVVDTYQFLIGKPLEDEIHMKASILGWAVELVRQSDALFLTFSYKLISLSRMISWMIPLQGEDNHVGTDAYIPVILPVDFIAKSWFHRHQRFFYVRSDNLFPSQKTFQKGIVLCRSP